MNYCKSDDIDGYVLLFIILRTVNKNFVCTSAPLVQPYKDPLMRNFLFFLSCDKFGKKKKIKNVNFSFGKLKLYIICFMFSMNYSDTTK